MDSVTKLRIPYSGWLDNLEREKTIATTNEVFRSHYRTYITGNNNADMAKYEHNQNFHQFMDSQVDTDVEAGIAPDHDMGGDRQAMADLRNLEGDPEPREKQVYKKIHEVMRSGLNQVLEDETKYSYRAITQADVATILIDLQPHQLEGIGRIIELETEHGGWILADEMGLGKTIQALGGIVKDLQSSPNSKKTTLIIVPTPLIVQWHAELAQTKLSVLEYSSKEHNDQYGTADFEKHDVVLTTYDRVSAEWSSLTSGCEAWSKRREGYTYVETRKLDKDGKILESKTVPVPDAKRRSAPLFNYGFLRIILDEGHRIKDPHGKRFDAAAHIAAIYKGIITGTPIQNEYWDFYALLKFIGIWPFDNEGFFQQSFIRKNRTGHLSSLKLNKDLELILTAVRKAVCVKRIKGSWFEGSPCGGVKP
jgi:SNF2 family DNA or RNA helicase